MSGVAIDAGPSQVTEQMTWRAICEQFPDQWVALVDLVLTPHFDVFTHARVVGHGPTRDIVAELGRTANAVFFRTRKGLPRMDDLLASLDG